MIEALAIGVPSLGALVIVTVLAFRLVAETRARGEAEKRGAVLDANNTMLATKLADTAEQLKKSQEANDDLEALLDDWAADRPIDGAFERLLAQRKARRSNRGDGAGTVHTDETAKRGDADRLLRPGEDP